MDLRFGGPCANRHPTQDVIEVTRRHRLQQLCGDRQAEPDHFTHQLPRQGQALGHVVTAIQRGVVCEAFPANRGAGLLDISAHHQQHLVADFGGQARQALGVFEGGQGIVDRARPDNDQQARIFTIENGADRLAVGRDLGGQSSVQRQLMLQRERRGQAFRGRAAVIQDDGAGRQIDEGIADDGRIHVLASWSAGIPARTYWGVRQLAGLAVSRAMPPVSNRSEAAGCPERRLLNRQAKSVSLR